MVHPNNEVGMSEKTKGERALIGARLKAARERAHIGVDDAAKAAVVQPLAIEKWERGAALPSLVEFKRLLEAYGATGSEVLYDVNPMEIAPDLVAELARAARAFSPELRAKVDCLIAMSARGVEPVWRT